MPFLPPNQQRQSTDEPLLNQRGGAHWRQLANTTEQPVRGDGAALCVKLRRYLGERGDVEMLVRHVELDGGVDGSVRVNRQPGVLDRRLSRLNHHLSCNKQRQLSAYYNCDSNTIQHPTRSYVLSSNNEHVNSFALL